MYCSKCGKEIEDDSLYCSNCGEKVKSSTYTGEKAKVMNYKIIFFIVVAVVFICFGSLLLIKVVKGIKDNMKEGIDVVEAVTEMSTQKPSVDNSEQTEKEVGEMEPQALREMYASIVDDLSQREAKDITQGEMDLLWALTEPFVNTKICKANEQHLTREFSDYEMSHILYKLVRQFDWDYLDTQVTVDYLEYKKDKDDNIIYEKEDLNRLINDYIDLGDKRNDCWQGGELFPDKDDKFVLFSIGVGDPWIAFRKLAVMENDNYKMVMAPCFYGDNSGVENQYEYTIRVLYEKTDDSSLGLRMVYADTTLQKPKIEKITVSSTLKDDTDNNYTATNMLDGNMATAWSEGVDGAGEGESITIQLDKRQQVFGILMLSGYCKDSGTYSKNGKILEIGVDYGNGKYEEFPLQNLYHDGEELEYYTDYPVMSLADNVAFMKPVMTDKIVIYILRASTGTKYEDTCVSELDVY